MRHGLPEHTTARGGVIDVQGAEISGEACEHRDLGLRDGSSRAFPFFTDLEIVK